MVLLHAVYPNKCSLYLGGVSSPALYQDKVNFWDNVYGGQIGGMGWVGWRAATAAGSVLKEQVFRVCTGFRMSCVKRHMLSEAAVLTVEAKQVATSVQALQVSPPFPSMSPSTHYHHTSSHTHHTSPSTPPLCPPTPQEFDLSSVTVSDLDFTVPIALQATCNGDIHVSRSEP